MNSSYSGQASPPSFFPDPLSTLREHSALLRSPDDQDIEASQHICWTGEDALAPGLIGPGTRTYSQFRQCEKRTDWKIPYPWQEGQDAELNRQSQVS